MIDANVLIPRPTLPNPVDYPPIAPVADGVDRPFFSVIIPTVNRPDFLRAVLHDVLAQGYGPDEMQICVVDNFTTNGDIAAICREVGGDRVEYVRQPRLMSVTENWNTCLQQSRGEYVQVLHDDMGLLPGYYDAVKAQLTGQDCKLLFGQIVTLDDKGNWRGMSQRVATTDDIADKPLQIITQPHTFIVPTMIAHRDLYEQVGGYYNAILYGCDQEIAARLISAAGRVGFMPKPLMTAVLHDGQSSHNFWASPGFREGDLLAWELVISQGETPAFRRQVYRFMSVNLAEVSQILRARGLLRMALHHAIWAYRFQPSAATFWNIIHTLLTPLIRFNKRRGRPQQRARQWIARLRGR